MSQAYDSSDLLLGLPEVARLAAVQRPVVSMWRLRKANTDTPFPAVARTVGGRPLFRGSEVAEWLDVTGLGNNPDHRADLAAFGSPAGRPRLVAVADSVGADVPIDLDRPDHFDALTALVCLTFRTGRQVSGLSAEELIDLADESDPDDEFLFSEIDGSKGCLEALAAYAADLVDAAYNPKAAFDLLLRQRKARHLMDPVQLAPDLQRLVSLVSLGLARQTSGVLPAFVDATPGGSDLLSGLVSLEETADAVRVHTVPGTDARSRRSLRHLLTHDLSWQPLAADEDNGYLIPVDAVALMRLPSVSVPDPSDLDVLHAINALSLQLPKNGIAVIVGPASALVDRLVDQEARSTRDVLLRSGTVRSVIRLPAGLLTDRPRQRLALCIIGPADDDPAYLSVKGRPRTAVADLADLALSPATIEAIVDDVLAAMWGATGIRSHTFSHLVPVPSSDLLVRRRELVLLGERAGRSVEPSPAESLLALEDLSGSINRPLPRLQPGAEPGVASGPARSAPIQDLITSGALRVHAGNRIDFSGLGADGAVRVIGVPELTGPPETVGRAVDRWALAQQYPDSRETEAGDVVFCTAPHPSAVVDPFGGSVVEAPARILRVAADSMVGLTARSVAADVNAQPAHSRAWRTWPIHVIPADQISGLDAALRQIDDARTDLAQRLASLESLTHKLVSAASGGAVEFGSSSSSPSTTKGN